MFLIFSKEAMSRCEYCLCKARIRRHIQDDALDIESFGSYEKEKTRLKGEIERQRRELLKEKTIRTDIAACIRKRNDILLDIFNAYKLEIERINANQSELHISITFKGDKTNFLEQLRCAKTSKLSSEIRRLDESGKLIKAGSFPAGTAKGRTALTRIFNRSSPK